MLIWGSIVAAYYQFLMIALLASIVGAIVVATLDAAKLDAMRAVPQH